MTARFDKQWQAHLPVLHDPGIHGETVSIWPLDISFIHILPTWQLRVAQTNNMKMQEENIEYNKLLTVKWTKEEGWN